MSTPIPPSLYSPQLRFWVLAGCGLFAFAIIVLRAYVASDAEPLRGEWFVGPDAYMRIVRVWDWIQGGSWYFTGSGRSNWPNGEVQHWTRPLDILLVALAAPLWPFVGLHKALFIAGVVISPLVSVVAMAVLVKGTRTVLDLRGQAILLVLFAFQPITRAYFLAARPDHHGLILLCFCIVLTMLLRFADNPNTHQAAPKWAGIAAAFGIWISVEALTTELFALSVLGLAWVANGDERWLNGLKRFAIWGALALAIMMGIERPPAEWLTAEEYDRLSSVHVVLLALIALGVQVMGHTRRRQLLSARLGFTIVAGLAAGVLMAALFGDFFKGPFGAAMDPRLNVLWLARVKELQPLITADWDSTIGAVLVLGPVVWLVVWAALRLGDLRPGQMPGQPFDHSVLILGLACALFLPLSVMQLRWGSYLGITVAIAWAGVFQRVLDWRGGPKVGPTPGTPILRAPAAIGVIVAHLAIALAFFALSPKIDKLQTPKTQVCKWRNLVPVLMSEAFASASPLVIFSHIHQGPEILYRTPHRVVGTPYHRNTDGILDTFSVLTTTDTAQARTILTRRNVDLVILCVDSDEEKYFLGFEGDTLMKKIVSETQPSWLKKVILPGGLNTHFRVFRVDNTPSW